MTPRDTPAEPGVYISPEQIYAELRRQSDALVRLVTQLERGRYEERITALERRMWVASGVAAAAGGALGWIVQGLGA